MVTSTVTAVIGAPTVIAVQSLIIGVAVGLVVGVICGWGAATARAMVHDESSPDLENLALEIDRALFSGHWYAAPSTKTLTDQRTLLIEKTLAEALGRRS